MNDRDAHAYAAFAREQIVFTLASVPINLAGVGYCRIAPYLGIPPGKPVLGQIWQVENVQVFCTAVTATATVRMVREQPGVSFNDVTLTPVTPVAGTVVQATMAALALRRSALGSNLVLTLNTNGTGTITNLVVTVTIRPYPMSGDA